VWLSPVSPLHDHFVPHSRRIWTPLSDLLYAVSSPLILWCLPSFKLVGRDF
jgi:hypothetical protein